MAIGSIWGQLVGLLVRPCRAVAGTRGGAGGRRRIVFGVKLRLEVNSNC